MMRRCLACAASALAGLLIAVPTTARAAQPATRPVEVAVDNLLLSPGSYAYPGVPAIAVRGELVGDFGVRHGGSVWTQLNGDGYAETPLLSGGRLSGFNRGIGVHIPGSLWPGFESAGGYRVRGPVVRLSGEWRFHDPERGGESYLEVTALEVVSGSVRLQEGVRWRPLGIGMGLLAAAGAAAAAARFGRRRGGTGTPAATPKARPDRSRRVADRRRR